MQIQTKPILLYDGECGFCRRIAHWVESSARNKVGEASVILMPVGDDPEALKLINPSLNIWDAYATNYLVMPDASMKTGGEAVAEVLRILPSTKWFAWCFALSIFGFRPFQIMLNFGYMILDDVRPIFGCESCGKPSFWVKPIVAFGNWASSVFGQQLDNAPTAKLNSPHVNLRRQRDPRPVIPAAQK